MTSPPQLSAALLTALTLLFVLVLALGRHDATVAGDSTAPGRYIVSVRDNRDPHLAAVNLGAARGFRADLIWDAAGSGFVASMTPAQAALVARDPSVRTVEPDGVVRAALHTNPFQTLPTGVDRVDVEENATAAITGQPGTDLNADIAILDTGIQPDHQDLRVGGGVRFIGPACTGGSFADDNGHGTHVAGTAAARDDNRGVVGVAPGARLWAVKVLNSSGVGSTSCLIQGINWVTERKLEFTDGPGDGDAGVDIASANMSIEGSTSSALCDAVQASVDAGVMYAVAAGNSGFDANNSGPANCAAPLTVSAFADFDGQGGGLAVQTIGFSSCTEDEDDSFACFSNYGSAVDIAAPGVEIVSTWQGGVYAWDSGTSMASPHVAGALALFRLATGYNGDAGAAAVMAALTAAGWTRSQDAACGFTGDPDAFPEPLLYLGNSCPSGPACFGDGDCDGWPDAIEGFLGTDPVAACPATTAPNDEPTDAWPPDFDDNRSVNVTDVLSFAPRIAANGYNPRWDLSADGFVSVTDILAVKQAFGTSCS